MKVSWHCRWCCSNGLFVACVEVDSFSTPTVLRRSLSEQAVRLDQFVDKQSSLVSLWFQAIKSRFSIQPAASPVLPDWTKVALPELRDLEFNLWEALSFIEQLDVFCRLNRDAIARIIQKARATTENWTWQNHGNGPLYVRPWSKEMTLMTALLGALQRTINLRLEDGDTASSRSLILEVVDPVALGCSQDDVVEEIIADDSSALMVVLASPVSYLENQAMLYSVTQVAILHHSIDCIESLLDEITVTLGGELCIHQDPLQQLITQFCRGSSLTVNTSNHSTLDKIIKHLSPYQHHLLWAKDWRQRLPLHYAAQHGLVEISSQMIKLMGLSATLEVDAFGETPLSLAAISGHSDIVNMFVDLDMRRLDGKSLVFTEEHVGPLMNVAIRSKSIDIVHILIKLGKGLGVQKQYGYTPLYNAARLGQIDIVKVLLDTTDETYLSITDDSYHWTPLTVACVCDHLDVARLLVLAGANLHHQDRRGWSALDHAAYRGHMRIVAMLQNATPTGIGNLMEPRTSKPPPSESATCGIPRPTYIADLSSDDPVLSSLFVNLGSFDVADRRDPVDLKGHVHKTKVLVTSSHRYLEVSAIECPNISYRLSLPFLGDVGDTTWHFLTENMDGVKLNFKLFEMNEGPDEKPKLIASAFALLDSIKGWFRSERQSLRRDSAVALVSPDGDFVGSVSFTFLVCKPFIPKQGTLVNRPQNMRSLAPAQVIGHRGE